VAEQGRRFGLIHGPRARLERVAQSRPWAAHVVRAGSRFSEARASRWGASIGYYGFLALFPGVTIIVGVLAWLESVLPFLAESDLTVQDGLSTGLVGGDVALITLGVGVLIFAMYAGWRFVSAFREALRVVGRQPPLVRGALLFEVGRDLAVLVLIVGGLFATWVIAGLATWLAEEMLDAIGLSVSWSTVTVNLIGVAAALVIDFLIALLLIGGLSGTRLPGHELVVASMLAAVGIWMLRSAAGLIVGPTLTNPIYGTSALAVAMLIYVTFLARWVLAVAAWAFTAEPDSQPAGTDDAGDRDQDPQTEDADAGSRAGVEP
jgi:membrane protein